jgi:hypothetical protein
MGRYQEPFCFSWESAMELNELMRQKTQLRIVDRPMSDSL